MTPTFTERHRQVMDGIGRNQSYKEIGAELNMAEATVRVTVRTIAGKIREFDELPPRWKILAYIRFQEWQAEHARHLPRPRSA